MVRTVVLFVGIIAALLVLNWHKIQPKGLDLDLIAAVERNDVVTVRWMLQQGADPNAMVRRLDPHSDWQGTWEVTSRYKPTSPEDLTVLARAIQVHPYHRTDTSNTAMIQALADAGANVNVRFTYFLSHPMMQSPILFDTTPLVEAARWDEWGTVAVLLAHHADVNAAENYSGNTCLMYAVVSGELGIVQALLSHGARVNTQDKQGETALFWVLYDGKSTGDAGDLVRERHPSSPDLHVQAIVMCLLRQGALINARDKNGETPLMTAASGNFATAGLVHLLLEQGADVNAQDSSGETALYHAVEYEPTGLKQEVDKGIIRELLLHGANPYRANKDGQTPLMLAKREKRPDLVALLKQVRARK